VIDAIFVLAALVLVLVCVYETAKRPPPTGIDSDDMREFIKEHVWVKKTTTTYHPEPKRADAESYYDRFRRMAEAKENQN
jgi:hypothetical protein